MKLSNDCLKSLCNIAVVGGGAIAGYLGIKVAAEAITIVTKSGELAVSLRNEQANACRKIVQNVSNSVSSNFEAWIAQEFRGDRAAQADLEDAVKEFDKIIHLCIPDAQTVVAKNIDAEALTDAMMEKAVEASLFVKRSEIAQRVFRTIIINSFAQIRVNDAFFKPLASFSFEALLKGQDEIKTKVDEGIALQKSHLEETRAIRYEIAREKGVEPEKLVPIFEALGHEKLTPDEMRERAEEAIAGIVAKANEIIKPSNDGADIDAAIGAARVKLKEIDTAGARGILAAKIAEEEEYRKQRLLPLLREQADIEKLALDRSAAKITLQQIVALDPANGWAWVEIGDLERIAGTTSAALEAFSKALAADREAGDEVRTSVALDKIGDVLVAQGDLSGALENYREGLEIARRLLSQDPSHSERARDVSVSLERIGDVLVAQGDLSGALENYREGLEICRRLLSQDPSHSERARDVSVSVNKIGDVLVAQGALEGALENYREGLEIRRRLLSQDPSHSERARDVSVSLERIGDVLVAQGDLSGALENYREGLEIRRRLLSQDPSHSERARDVSVSVNKIGDVLVAQGALEGALENYREGLEIARRLLSQDPSHSERARDVSVSVNKIGDVLVAQGALEGALENYREGLEIRRRLLSQDPSHSERARDVSVSVNKIGDVLVAQGALEGALENYREGLEIRRRLLSQDPSHSERARDVSVSVNKIGDVLRAQGDLSGALENYREGLEIRRRLLSQDPSHSERARDVIVSSVKLSEVETDKAASYLSEALRIAEGLAAQGRLAPVDAWMPGRLREMLAAAQAG